MDILMGEISDLYPKNSDSGSTNDETDLGGKAEDTWNEHGESFVSGSADMMEREGLMSVGTTLVGGSCT